MRKSNQQSLEYLSELDDVVSRSEIEKAIAADENPLLLDAVADVIRWYGIASQDAGARLQAGDPVKVSFHPTKFRLPADPGAPIISNRRRYWHLALSSLIGASRQAENAGQCVALLLQSDTNEGLPLSSGNRRLYPLRRDR